MVLLLKPLGVIKGGAVRVAVAVALVVATEPAPEFPGLEDCPDSVPDAREVVAVADREPPVPVPREEDVAEMFQPAVADRFPEVITGVDPL